ncbi:hypothetical protein V0R50_18410 [Pseudomonas sp. 148P]|uniref:Uncharacterized protein n=1 Tax=Pseudomonas ulcerans TaxID=3115852 RepID=A0ABU7HUI2_9PSED|nr:MULTISPECIES: hypothetical protein [unclassified Pseudomonas]MEE1924030.1 hypothetical protein [Pseudomonas sp. 147P]MEE1935207.1 hypothetical protein [Pseudomonas sp. 148P]
MQKRLKAQSVLGWQDVFGDLADNEALRCLLGQWLALEANQAAAELAKVNARRAEQHYA